MLVISLYGDPIGRSPIVSALLSKFDPGEMPLMSGDVAGKALPAPSGDIVSLYPMYWSEASLSLDP